MSLAATVAEKANLIWAIADKLTGVFKPHQYGEVILPLTVIRRFDSVLEPTKEMVLQAAKTFSGTPLEETMLCNAAGHKFYNSSPFTFTRLLDDPDGLEPNFRAYCNAFSPNVRQILERFKPFGPHLTTMAEKNVLYMVLKEFTTSKADLPPPASPIWRWATFLKNSSAAFPKRTTRTPGSTTPRARSSS
ncbi:type I restriction-modification system subunit M N-terminal domain-containing protein [Desulfovibrio piger]|uniref:type I restriction-modification system subunit M N-terminal domain-containing protein n=1 Tax=Desulfovibrio piger TaxID=901 RepID=UPI0032C0ABF8